MRSIKREKRVKTIVERLRENTMFFLIFFGHSYDIIKIENAVAFPDNIDVTREIMEKDGVFFELRSNQTLFVTFEKELSMKNDISIYGAGKGANAYVYNDFGYVGVISSIEKFGKYTLWLTNMNGNHRKFRIFFDQFVIIDQIIDPPIVRSELSIQNMSTIKKGEHISVMMMFSGSIIEKTAFYLYHNEKLIKQSIYSVNNPSGGSVSIINDFWIHRFTNVGSSTFNVPNGISLNVEYLVVGGGGGGGAAFEYSAGGGGAGGFVSNSLIISSGSTSIIVGAGGAGSSSRLNRGENGGNSFLGSIEAKGGGGGGSGFNAQLVGVPPGIGASGGGGGGQIGSRTTSGAAGTQGTCGGNGKYDNNDCSVQSGAGGGGAAGAGENGQSTRGGNGGAGKVFYGEVFSHGGDGGRRYPGSGSGCPYDYRLNGNNGVENTGNGGGGGSGGGNSLSAKGGNGGSGIVILRHSFIHNISNSQTYYDLNSGVYKLVSHANLSPTSCINQTYVFKVIDITQNNHYSMTSYIIFFVFVLQY